MRRMSKPHLTLIDGSGFIFRAFHALPPLTSPQGVPVGAVYGFVNMVLKLLGDRASAQDHEHIAVIFDASRITFRNRIYELYKANRTETPEDLIPQFPLVREATKALGLPCIEMENYEADDIIATYTRMACEQGMEVRIVSSDKDLMQLVGDCVTMFDAMKNKDITPVEVMEKFGVPPTKVLDVLSLIGDTSDNVPGVPSIGPKTAAELINQFGDLDSVLARTSEIKQPKRRAVLEENKAQALLSRELIKLECNVDLEIPIEGLALKPLDKEVLATFLESLGFKTLVAKLRGGAAIAAAPAPQAPAAPTPQEIERKEFTKNYTTVSTEAELITWLEKARSAGRVAFDTETTSLDATQAELVGFSLCVEAGEACYVPLAHREAGSVAAAAEPVDLFSQAPAAPLFKPGQIPLKRAVELLKPILEDPAILKIGHNIKYDAVVMDSYGVRLHPVEDSMLLSYVLSAGLHGQGMDELSQKYLHHKPISYDEVTGTGVKRLRFDEVDIDKASSYAAEDADVTLRLQETFKPRVIAEKLATLYETIERPLIGVIARMEEAGIKVDVAKLIAMSSDFSTKMAVLEAQIKSCAECDFNVASPKQLGEVLFEKLALPGGKKSSKTGAYSTGSDVLEELAEAGHEIAAQVIEHRALAKLKNTYCDTLPKQIHPKTGRVHTCFAMAATTTGRLSSSDPNLQNIPIRTEEGRKIREAFIAEPGNILLSADYSQIELRLLAHMADIEVLKAAFRNGDDIHAITASKVFNVPLAEMTPELRRRAKAINFGIIYGISAHGLSVQLGIGRGEAGEIIKHYFATYPGIRDYMEHNKQYAREHGYVETLFKRRCHTPLINDRNPARRQFAERAAINAPLQGTAADIIKRAMVALDKQLTLDCRMLLQVHDELIFEMKQGLDAEWAPKIKNVMEGAAELSVPLVVETGVGQHWGEAH